MGVNHLASGPWGSCAWIAPNYYGCPDLQSAAYREPVRWTCECGALHGTLANTMIHLNNDHKWTWDMFANKFRTTVEQAVKESKS